MAANPATQPTDLDRANAAWRLVQAMINVTLPLHAGMLSLLRARIRK